MNLHYYFFIWTVIISDNVLLIYYNLSHFIKHEHINNIKLYDYIPTLIILGWVGYNLWKNIRNYNICTNVPTY